jgi:hypothetical protein
MILQTGPTPRKCGRIGVLLVLTPMMMLNASQAMTLCVRHDGHIALELVIGDRCTCDMQAAGADDILLETTSHLMEGPSHSCSDFVVPIGACSVRAAPATSVPLSGVPDVAPPLPLWADIDALVTASLESPPAFSCHSTSLSSVILRV